MEQCIEARALKKSTFLSELAVNSSSQDSSFIDDLVFANGVIANGDDFSVDGFLDFSNEDFIDEEEGKDSLSASEEREDDGSDTWRVCVSDDSEVLTAADLSVPVDDMENLEWLSQIVDDSASESSLLCSAGNYNLKTGNSYTPKTGTISKLNRFEPSLHTNTPILCFPSTIPAKARTKRLRTGGRSWSGGSPESSGDCSPTSTLIFSNSAWNRFQARFENTEYSEEVVKPPTASKRGRKRSPAVDGSGDASLLVQRRCSHCQVQKTPQWRNGPLGPKTLCNACGVRFKSGRLFPEYRPACSPTFLGDVHSNSHRKVLEMRRKKEVTTDGPGLVI